MIVKSAFYKCHAFPLRNMKEARHGEPKQMASRSRII